jgi:hypothetical protein
MHTTFEITMRFLSVAPVICILISKAECYPQASELVTSKHQCGCIQKSAACCRGGSDRPNSVSPSTSNVESIASNRRACHFYLWNAPSALLSRWCNHLQKDNIYEGRGGKKVRTSSVACAVFRLLLKVQN